MFASVDAAVGQCVAVAGTLDSDAAASAQYDRVYAVYRDTYTALRETMHRLAALDV